MTNLSADDALGVEKRIDFARSITNATEPAISALGTRQN